jgi:hypothetical protein
MNAPVTMKWNVRFTTQTKGRRVLGPGPSPNATRSPVGRVPRASRLMALAIKMDGLVRNGQRLCRAGEAGKCIQGEGDADYKPEFVGTGYSGGIAIPAEDRKREGCGNTERCAVNQHADELVKPAKALAGIEIFSGLLSFPVFTMKNLP